jgi:non-ribosomal peptide synthetase-like protein
MISDPLPTVRLLIVSGERCSEEIVNRWATPRRRMLNVYGPTETTVNATAAECRPGQRVTIGKPLPGYKIHLLDEEQRPVATGEKGEIFIAGPGVARGYLNQPELTEKQFTAVAVGTGGEVVRAYRSGDLASLAADGELLFHGRVDDQVKIRGFRVELSEIESVLSEHPLVRAAVVTVVERDGTDELAAHVTAEDPERGIDRDALRKFADSRLPSYMVPAYLDVLDVLPVLQSGKVDRKRLPVPATRLVPSRSIRRPVNELEAVLHRAFCRIFESESISIDDDFFGVLGGYSLLAARLVSELRQESFFEIAIRDVYDHPTIEKLATHLSAKAPKSRRTDRGSAVRERVSSRRIFRQLPRATRFACVALQALSVYAIYGVLALPYAASLMSLRQWRTGAVSSSTFVAHSLLITAGTWPALLALSIVVKWLVIGRYRPGAYPVWGFYYFRFWLARRFEVLAFPNLLVGTPLLPLYYRLMGAKVGRNCTIDTIHCAIFDLLTIGSDTSIGSETQLLGYRIEDGLLIIGSIAIGSRCFVGIHSALGLDVRMADEARLDDLSLLPDGAAMARGESRRGSPARPGAVTVPEVPFGAALPRRRILFGCFHLLGIYAILFALMPAGLPSAAILRWADASASTAWQIVAIPAAGVTAMAAFCLWVALLRRLILPRAKVGVFPVESFFYLRKWAMFTLMELSRAVARPLYTTIYLAPWLRLLGARIGRRAEISTVSQISPELTELGEQSFFADGSMISGRRVYRGLFELGVSRVGRRSFLGNGAILPLGKSLGQGCLIGCLSVPPEETDHVPDGTEWLGSPSFALPHRRKMECFDESVTHEPTTKLVLQRLAVDALRIAIPSTIVTAQLCAFAWVFESLSERWSPTRCLLAMPAVAVAVAAAGLLAVVATKKILIGTFRPTVKPLWSMFVWLNEVVNGTYETVAAPLLVPLLGTPFGAPWLRLLGCKIGRHVYLETTLFSEFDLVDIGDYAALNAGAVIQNHLFEDRIMKASTLRVGDECSVGNMAVVLYDTEMETGSAIGPLSLLMRGETLPRQTRWLGIPTAEVPLNKNTAAFSLPAFEHGANVIASWS